MSDRSEADRASNDLVERVALAIDSAICGGDQSSVAMELTSEEIKVLARAAIAFALEEAAEVADDEACHCEDTGSAPSDFGNAGRNDAARTIAAAIRALIPKAAK